MGVCSWDELLSDQVRRNGRWLFAAAYRIVHDVATAEDVCQAALAKAWENRRDINDPRVLSAWLTRVVVNESLTVLRRRKCEARAMEAEQRSPRKTSDDPAHRAAETDAVHAALDQLAEPARTIVVLRTMHGLSGVEVARKLDCSPGEVSRQLHRGMEQLRQVLR